MSSQTSLEVSLSTDQNTEFSADSAQSSNRYFCFSHPISIVSHRSCSLKTNPFEILRVCGEIEEIGDEMNSDGEKEVVSFYTKGEEEGEEETNNSTLKSFRLIFEDDFVPFVEGDADVATIDVTIEVRSLKCERNTDRFLCLRSLKSSF
jgi:hypothetical protein